MLDLEVIPERAVSFGQWQFVLGMHLAQAVEVLKRQCSVVRKVQLKYSDQHPFEVDVILDLVQDGIKLIFDPKLQKLKMIEIYDIQKVKLRYCNSYFSSLDVVPTVEQIHHTFGPTLPGEHDSKQQQYRLLFRGLLLVFPTGSIADAPTLLEGGGASLSSFSPGDSQQSLILSRVCIFSGNNPMESRAPSRPMECYLGSCYGEQVEVIREGGVACGLRLNLMTDDSHHSKSRIKEFDRTVWFGDTVQDVLTSLGSPSQLYYKAEDKMRIHSPSPHKLPASKCSDYFFNYITLGVDLLFDASTHKVKKFVLHTNLPGHYNFNVYYHCNFVITFQEQEDESELKVTPLSKWSEVQEHITLSCEKPVVLNRTPSTNNSNPFGSTYCYGYQNIIFEVMRNNYIASVTIYATPPSA